MQTQDTCCSIAPYFQIRSGQLEAFKDLTERMVETSCQESKCLYYGFSFEGSLAHCREGYEDAEGLLAHLDNIGSLLEEALKIADIIRLEVHGRADQLEKLQEPLAGLAPQFFCLENGFRTVSSRQLTAS